MRYVTLGTLLWSQAPRRVVLAARASGHEGEAEMLHAAAFHAGMGALRGDPLDFARETVRALRIAGRARRHEEAARRLRAAAARETR